MFHFCPSVNHKTKARILIHIQSSILVGGDETRSGYMHYVPVVLAGAPVRIIYNVESENEIHVKESFII